MSDAGTTQPRYRSLQAPSHRSTPSSASSSASPEVAGPLARARGLAAFGSARHRCARLRRCGFESFATAGRGLSALYPAALSVVSAAEDLSHRRSRRADRGDGPGESAPRHERTVCGRVALISFAGSGPLHAPPPEPEAECARLTPWAVDRGGGRCGGRRRREARAARSSGTNAGGTAAVRADERGGDGGRSGASSGSHAAMMSPAARESQGRGAHYCRRS